MRKLIIIFLLIPFACKAQDRHVMTTEDILINVVLENIANYFENKNKKEMNLLEINSHKKDSIDWNKTEFIKWQITEPKNSLQVISL